MPPCRNSGVVGRDNGGGANQQDIPCQDIVLSSNGFDSVGGIMTSGYSPFAVRQPGATVRAMRGRGVKRCRAEGAGRFTLFVGAAVLANNLMILARLLTKRSSRRPKAAR